MEITGLCNTVKSSVYDRDKITATHLKSKFLLSVLNLMAVGAALVLSSLMSLPGVYLYGLGLTGAKRRLKSRAAPVSKISYVLFALNRLN
jgi:hypothetical protein